MKKIRSFLVVIALVATLGGFSIQGLGSMANTAGYHAGSSVAAGQSSRSIASVHRYPICPVPGHIDC